MFAHERVISILGRAIAPPPTLAPSDWIEQNCILPPGSAMPGKFSFSTTPYFKGPADDLSPESGIKTVVISAGAQLGKTQLLLNILSYWIATDPKPIMAVWPTVDVAKRLVTTRIDPTFDLIPAVKQRLVPERSRERGNSMFLKRILGGSELIICGANAPAPLRSSPINFCLLDEVSAFPGSTDEGDVLDLVSARQITYCLTAKTLLTSTPLDEGTCRITRAYEETDQRKFFLPCLQCGHRWVPAFGDIRYPTDRPDLAVLVCPACGRPHDDHDKTAQLAAGEWRPTAVSVDPLARGYWLSGLYSPWLTYAKIAAQHRKVARDPARLRVFVNTVLAETWRSEDGESLDVDGLPSRRFDHAGVLPADTVVVTAGVDCQDDRLEVTLWAWSADERAMAFRHVIIHGDPAGTQLWSELDDLLMTPIPHARAVPDMIPRAVAIDSGGHFTSNVYAFCRPRAKRRIWAIRGKAGAGVPLWPNSAKSIYKAKGGCKVHSIGVDQAKRLIYSRLKVTQADAPGYIGFDASLSDSYFIQLTAERLVSRYSRGRQVQEWVCPSGVRNESLDCAAYALAALHSLYIGGFDLARESAAMATYPLRDFSKPGLSPSFILSRRPITVRSSLFS